MKKSILFFALVIATCYSFAQCGMTTYLTTNTYGITVSSQSCGSTDLVFNWNCYRKQCPNSALMPATSSATIKLRYNPNSFSMTGSTLTTINTSYFTAYPYTVTQSGYYWFEEVTAVTTTTQDCCGSSGSWVQTYYNGSSSSAVYVTVNSAPTSAGSTYKIDGQAVNSSTYLQEYTCHALQMTNITWNGSTSPNIPGQSVGYQWKVEISKVGGLTDNGTWFNGTPGTTYDLKSRITNYFGTLTGQYNVKLIVRNYCNTTGVTYSGLVQINTSPDAATSGYALSINNTCSTFTFPGTQSSPASVCGTNPKLASYTVTQAQLIGGYYRLKVEEYTSGNTFVKNIINTGNLTLNSTADVVCLDMGYLASPQFYWANNTSGYKYKVIWTIGNVCGESTNSSTNAWFYDNLGGCKTDGEEATALNDQTETDNFMVYPNPANSEITVKSGGDNIHPNKVKLFSVDGRDVTPEISKIDKDQLVLDVHDLQPGVYLVQVNGTQVKYRKIVIE